jgi:KDO2-lipid IV(A) lauroyltransferase
VFKKILRQAYFILAFIFSKIVLLLPYKISVKSGGLLGLAAYYLVAGSRNITEENLAQSFPDKSAAEIKSIARKVFFNQGKNVFELFSFPKFSLKDIASIAELGNESRLSMQEALGKNKGVLIASAHCGNWEMMGASLSANGFPINVIARRIYIDGLNRMLVSFRNKKNVNVILRSGRNAAKEILRSLRNNEAIGMLIDQDTRVPGVFVDFFSRPAWTPSGLAVLALKTGASVVLALDVRLKDDRHKPVVTGPFDMINTGNFDEDVRRNTQLITAKIEEHIRKYPEQWVWMHQRWQTKQ